MPKIVVSTRIKPEQEKNQTRRSPSIYGPTPTPTRPHPEPVLSLELTCGNSVSRNKTSSTMSSRVVLSVLLRRLDALVRLLTLRQVLPPPLPLMAITRTLPVVCTAAVVVATGAPWAGDGCRPAGSWCCDDGCGRLLIRRLGCAPPPTAVCGVLSRRPSLSLADLSSAL